MRVEPGPWREGRGAVRAKGQAHAAVGMGPGVHDDSSAKGLALARFWRNNHPVNADEQRILLTQASPGMSLARQVQLPNQMVLCPRGTELTRELIHRLMVRGIKRIYIKGSPLTIQRLVSYTERRDRLKHAFTRARAFPHMAALEQVLERLLVRRP